MFPKAFHSYIPRTHCIERQTYGAIILSHDEEILLVEGRKTGKWSFPKGHGKLNEKPLDAAIREVQEETGINLEGKPFLRQRRLRSSSTRSGGTYFVYHLDDKPDIVPQDEEEISQGSWFPLWRLPHLKKNMDLNTFCNMNLHMYPEKI